jgi:hypothetical protein
LKNTATWLPAAQLGVQVLGYAPALRRQGEPQERP